MAKHFSKKYGNKGWAFDYPVSAIYMKNVFEYAVFIISYHKLN